MSSDTHLRPVPIAFIAGASFIGTTIEYYDFFLFGTAAALIFNKAFFPTLGPLFGTLASFATFGAAFISRPIGGVIFGHFGDKVGRKNMLVTSLLMMGGATVAVGLTPTYEQIGVAAPLLLVLARFVQGLAVGGEWSGAVLMAAEHAPAHRRALYASWTQSGAPAGLVLGTASFWLVQSLPEDIFESWGWRIPFIFSAVLVLVGMWIRLRVTESPAFAAMKRDGAEEAFPAAAVLREARKPLLITIFSIAGTNVFYYIANVYLIKYATEHLGVSRSAVLAAICLGSLFQIFTIPIASLMADKVGRKPVLLFGNVMLIATAFPIFWLVNTAQPLALCFALVLGVSFAHALVFGPLAGFACEQFPTRMRYTGSAIGIQVGGLISSGPVPFIATGLVLWGGGSWPLSCYIIIASMASIVAIAVARETFRDGFETAARPGGESPTQRPRRESTSVRKQAGAEAMMAGRR